MHIQRGRGAALLPQRRQPQAVFADVACFARDLEFQNTGIGLEVNEAAVLRMLLPRLGRAA